MKRVNVKKNRKHVVDEDFNYWQPSTDMMTGLVLLLLLILLLLGLFLISNNQYKSNSTGTYTKTGNTDTNSSGSEPPTAKVAGISNLCLRRSGEEMMTPYPCERHARTGSPNSLTETYSHRRLGCIDGQGNHTDCSSDAA